VGLLLEYLHDSAVSPLEQEFVESTNALCSSVSPNTSDLDSCIGSGISIGIGIGCYWLG